MLNIQFRIEMRINLNKPVHFSVGSKEKTFKSTMCKVFGGKVTQLCIVNHSKVERFNENFNEIYPMQIRESIKGFAKTNYYYI